MFKYILMFLLITTPCYAITVTTARGEREINDGDTVKKISFWKGTMTGLKDVTFDGSGRGNACNFSRKIPHTKVFINCTNLTFINCNLVNVELQEDFTVQSSLTLHQRKYDMLGKKYLEMETKNGKTTTYEIDEHDNIIKQTKTEDTPNEKKIKVKYVHPNTGVVTSLNTISSIE